MTSAAARELRLARLWLEAERCRDARRGDRRPPRLARGRSHLLLISSEFPPAVGVGAIRPGALVEYAAAHGWRTSVITMSAARGATTARPAPSRRAVGGRTTRVIRVDPRQIFDDPPWMPATSQWFSMALEMFHRGRTRLRHDPPAAIIATGPGFHTFIAGRYLARLFKTPLVLDYRDEWTLRPRFPWVEVRAADPRWEGRCLASADRVLFVTRPLLEQQLSAFPALDRRRCRVVPNGWEPRDFGLHKVGFRPQPPRSTITRIGYFGFMADHQRPGPFLDAMARLLDSGKLARTALRIRIAGVVDGAALDELTAFKHASILEPIRWVARRRAASMMRRCSALLIVNEPRMRRALPMKLFDYLASGRPILVYGNGDSEMNRLVTRLGAGVCVPDGDDDALARALERFGNRPASHWQTASRLSFLQRHTRERMARRLLEEAAAAIRGFHS